MSYWGAFVVAPVGAPEVPSAQYADQSLETGSTINVPSGSTSGRITHNHQITTLVLAGVTPADMIALTFHGDPSVTPGEASKRNAARAGVGQFQIAMSGGATGEPIDWLLIKRDP